MCVCVFPHKNIHWLTVCHGQTFHTMAHTCSFFFFHFQCVCVRMSTGWVNPTVVSRPRVNKGAFCQAWGGWGPGRWVVSSLEQAWMFPQFLQTSHFPAYFHSSARREREKGGGGGGGGPLGGVGRRWAGSWWGGGACIQPVSSLEQRCCFILLPSV